MMIDFIPSGSTLLDEVLGGGWAIGRMSRVAGDPSTGKTQIAIAAAANFHKKYPEGVIKYCDSEAAFDTSYAETLGLAEDALEFIDANTVEDFFDALNDFIKATPDDTPGLVILDSLDALSTNAQKALMKTADEAGYEGGRRAALIGTGIKKAVSELRKKNIHLMIICQVRDNLSGFGEKRQVSGGNAPKFYASQRIMLKVLKKLDRTISGQTMPYGVKVQAYCDKNKIAPPFKECIYDIIYNRGIDDVGSCLEWLESVKQLNLLPEELSMTPDPKSKKGETSLKVVESYKTILNRIQAMQDKEQIREAVKTIKKVTVEFFRELQKQNHEKTIFIGVDNDD